MKLLHRYLPILNWETKDDTWTFGTFAVACILTKRVGNAVLRGAA